MALNREDLSDSFFWQAHDLEQAGETAAAFDKLCQCLEIVPEHTQALIMRGEICLLRFDRIQMTEKQGIDAALACFDRVLDREPESAEAWSCKSLALVYGECYDEAIVCADKGLTVIALRRGYAMHSPAKFINVWETCFDCKIRALLGLERLTDAFAMYHIALLQIPDSAFLRRNESFFDGEKN